MNAIETILLNFSETRRRSIKLWTEIPESYIHWKPDHKALSIIEMIRHVLEGEHLYHTIIERRGDLKNYISPWIDRPYTTIEAELNFAKKYNDEFKKMVKSCTEDDLKNIIIKRDEVGQKKLLGDYLNRMVYHESVHAGQLLSYLRILGVKRPLVWD